MVPSLLIRNVLWIAPLLIQAAILFVLISRKMLSSFPIFSAYTGAVLLRECILLFLTYPGRPYALVYWYGEIATIIFGLGAILETVRYLCTPYSLKRIGLRLIWGAVVLSSFVPVLMLVTAASGRALQTVILAERSVRLVQACWLILVIVLVSQLGSSWREFSVGITAGFGTYSALSLAIFELSARLHLLSDNTVVILNSAAYNLAAVIWGIYFLRPQHKWASHRLPELNLSEWKNAVTAYCTQQWHRQH